MLPGFIDYEANHTVESLKYQRLDINTTNINTQDISIAGIPNPGCVTECYCSLFQYTCYERCNGQIVRVWDAGWCFGW